MRDDLVHDDNDMNVEMDFNLTCWLQMVLGFVLAQRSTAAADRGTFNRSSNYS